MNSNERPSVPPSSMRLSPSRRVLIACCALVGLALAGLALVALLPRRAPPPYAYPGCTPEQVEVFQLLDEFYPYEVTGCPFVDVSVGGFVWPGDGIVRDSPLSSVHRHGFLVEATEATLRVCFLDGERARLSRTPNGTPAWHRVGFTAASLRDHGVRLAAEAADGHEFLPSPLTPISATTTSLLAARALARSGALRDLGAVWRALPESSRARGRLLALSARNCFADDLANRLALDCADASLSWGVLLERHERWLALACDGDPPGGVRERRDELLAMLDRRHGFEWLLEPFVADPVEELRAAARSNQGGRWAIWPVPPWEPAPSDPFAAVVARGLAVVPALVEALTDPSPSRSLYYHNNGKGHFGVYARSVGGVAEDALEEIFGGPGYIVTESLWKAMGADDWLAWYEETKARGLQPYLRAKMRNKQWAVDAAASWLRRWPQEVDSVLDAANELPITEGLQVLACATSSAHCVGPTRARAAEMLRAIAREAGIAECTSAAQQLLEIEDDGGVLVLRDRWLRGETLGASAWFVLLASGAPGIWDDVVRRLDDSEVRRGIAGVARAGTREELTARVVPAHREEVESTLRRCLWRVLGDVDSFSTPTRWGFGIVHRDEQISLHRASNADVVASALSSWWPDEYQFDPTRTTTVRRRQIDAMLRALGRPVPPSPPREPGRTQDEIGTIQFGAGTDAFADELKQGLRVIEHTEFEASRIRATLAAIAARCPINVLLHFERTGDGDGWSVLCESTGVRDRGEVDTYTAAGIDLRASRPDGAAEITFVAH